MISLIIPHVPYSKEADDMLNRCLSSLKEQSYDEFIQVVNDGIGYGAAFNRGMRYARGEYLLCVSNDTQLLTGNILDLCDPTTITTPRVNGENVQFGCFFCLPREMYEKVGGFDERFRGAYYEDNDLLLRWHQAGYNLKVVDSVHIAHEGGTTVKAIMKEDELAQANRLRFLDKWGKLP